MHVLALPAGGPRVAYPLGPLFSGQTTVRGLGRPGSAGPHHTDQSALDTAMVNAPVWSDNHSVHIAGGLFGEDGSDIQATYRAHAFRPAVYTQSGWASAAPWQEDQYAEDARALLRPPAMAIGQQLLYAEIEASRPPVYGVDYNLGQYTSDAQMSYGYGAGYTPALGGGY